MMIEIKTTEYFERRLAKICSKRPKVAILLVNALRLLTQTEFSSATLKVHKLSGDKKNQFAFSLNYDLRVIFKRKGKEIWLLNIGSHDEVY